MFKLAVGSLSMRYQRKSKLPAASAAWHEVFNTLNAPAEYDAWIDFFPGLSIGATAVVKPVDKEVRLLMF